MSKSLSGLLLETTELRAGSVITEREINALKRRWSPMGRLAQKFGAQKECMDFMEGAPYQISDEHAESGFAWWRAQCFTPTGKRRATKFTSYLRRHDWDVIDSATRFELVDWYWQTNGYGMYWPFPVYRMLTDKGYSFDYVARPWQSGGTFLLYR